MDWEKYRSRKFIMSILIGVTTTLLAYAGKMDAHSGLVFASLIASYNITQGLIDRGDKK